MTCQPVDLDQGPGIARQRAGLVEQRDCAAGQAGQPARFGRLPQQPRADLAVGGEPPGALERGSRGRVRAAIAAAGRRLGERGRRRFVGADGRRREVPGAAVHIPVGQRGRQRPVRRTPLAGGRVGVDRRSGQRMAELHRARAEPDQSGVLRGGQAGQVGLEPGGRPFQRRQVAGIAGGGQHQGLAGGISQPAGAAQEGARDAGRHRYRRAVGSQLQVGCARRELEQRERVACGRPVQLPGCLRRHLRHQAGRLVAGQPADPERGQAGSVEQGRLALTHRDQDRDRVGHQPAEGEQERLRARSVQPLSVVDDHRHRSLLGVGREQAERRGAECEAVLRRPGPQGQGTFQRHGLGFRDLVEQHQSRADEFQQGPERDLCLGLDAARTQQLHPVGPADRELEQRGLADPRLPGQGQHRAGARARQR